MRNILPDSCMHLAMRAYMPVPHDVIDSCWDAELVNFLLRAPQDLLEHCTLFQAGQVVTYLKQLGIKNEFLAKRVFAGGKGGRRCAHTWDLFTFTENRCDEIIPSCTL